MDGDEDEGDGGGGRPGYLEMGDGDEGSEKWAVGDGDGWRRG